MATRAPYNPAPVLSDAGHVDTRLGPVYTMEPHAFDNAVRAVKQGRGVAAQVKAVGLEECKRLGVVPASRHAVAGFPDGSDQHDAQSLILWMRRVPIGDAAAAAQVQALTATAIQFKGYG